MLKLNCDMSFNFLSEERVLEQIEEPEVTR